MDAEPQKITRTGARTQSVADAIRTRIARRVLAPGDRLPSIRAFAKTMGVAASTVVEAYDRLAAEGLIRARPGSGFYVSSVTQPPLALGHDVPQTERAVDPFWVSRQSLDTDPSAVMPGCGWLPADWMPHEELRRALRASARAESAHLTNYGHSHGSPALRHTLRARFADEGIEVSPEQILLTSSGTQAVDLLCRFLLRPGDAVVVDDPCYFNFRALLRAHQVTVLSVPYTPTGPDLKVFEAVINAVHPRLYITNSAIHNPTGATLSAQTAHRLLNMAASHDMIIVEDEIFADFEPEPSARLAALDGLSRVIRVGSFSKTLSASVRCGYIAARADWTADLVDLQIATSFGGPSPLSADLIAHVLSGGKYRKHMEDLRRRLTRARRRVFGRLQDMGIEPWLMPRGGFYLWCRLPEGCDSADLARAALRDKIVLAPGNVFSVAQSATAFMRFNVAHCDDLAVMDGLGRMLQAVRG